MTRRPPQPHRNATISPAAARRLALNAQLLDGRTRLPRGKEGVARAIEHLGYVQIDTISVVERAHHHTLRSRRSDYTTDALHDLQARDRRIFEYWGHAASYLPMSDFRFCLPRMRRFRDPEQKWVRARLESHRHLMKPVLERIRHEGPLGSRDFAPAPGVRRGPWWDWKPAKIALELLFWQGKLMITERRSFQRIYDLTERVLPDGTDTRPPDDGELGRFLVERALSAHGIATEPEIRDHIHGAGRDVIARAIADLVDAGRVIAVTIDPDPKTTYFAHSRSVRRASRLAPAPPEVRILSPFDNFLIHRERTRRLFDFDYSLECYVPAAKRRHGYFVLPILWGERFIGRMDATADRKTATMMVRSLRFEPGFRVDGELLPALTRELAGFARFNRCRRLELQAVSPARSRSRLSRLVATALS